jgi:hypothetical protein
VCVKKVKTSLINVIAELQVVQMFISGFDLWLYVCLMFVVMLLSRFGTNRFLRGEVCKIRFRVIRTISGK